MLALLGWRMLTKWRYGLATSVLLTTLVVGCEDNDATAPAPPALANADNGPNGKNAPVRVTPARDTLNALHDTLQLAANVEVTWRTLNPTIASVDERGRVVSVGTGLGLIQALGAGGRKADTAEILVRQLPASVEVSPDTLTVPQGFEDTLTAVTADANGFPILDAVVTWFSEGTSVATVIDGIVTGVDTGTAIIRAVVGELSDSALVRVGANPYP
jgi:uncharacterized protein YjdB